MNRRRARDLHARRDAGAESRRLLGLLEQGERLGALVLREQDGAHAVQVDRDGRLDLELLRELERALGELAAQVRPWDSVVLFVASHGVMDGQRYHLVTAGLE